MSDLKVLHRTGACALAVVILSWAQFPLWMVGKAPSSWYDGAAWGHYLFTIHNVALTRILMDLGIYVAIMVFAAGFSQLIRQARAECEWAGTLVFGSAAVWLGVTLVADGLEGGAVLDTLSGHADPSVVRGLTDGTLLIYNGSICFAITGLFLWAAGYSTLATSVLPHWTGWLAYIGAALCAVCVPAMYGGPANFSGFYNPAGWGPIVIANFPPLIWFLVVGVWMIRRREATAPGR